MDQVTQDLPSAPQPASRPVDRYGFPVYLVPWRNPRIGEKIRAEFNHRTAERIATIHWEPDA